MTSPFTPPTPGVPRKKSATEIASRREETYELHFVRGLSVAAISAIQGVSEGTVRSDTAAIKKHLADELRSADIVEEVAVQRSYYAQMRRDAMVEFSRCDEAKEKAGFLLMALKATNQETNFLINIGYFPNAKRTIDLEVRHEVEAGDVGDKQLAEVINDPIQRTQVLSFLEKLTGGAKSLTLDVEGRRVESTPPAEEGGETQE